jgi:hypothetical protein
MNCPTPRHVQSGHCPTPRHVEKTHNEGTRISKRKKIAVHLCYYYLSTTRSFCSFAWRQHSTLHPACAIEDLVVVLWHDHEASELFSSKQRQPPVYLKSRRSYMYFFLLNLHKKTVSLIWLFSDYIVFWESIW